MNGVASAFPFRTEQAQGAAAGILQRGAVTAVVGQIKRIDLGWAGRVRCVLTLSIGDITIVANRDKISLDLRAGDWIKVSCMRWNRDGSPALMLLGKAVAVAPKSTLTWMPTAHFHRAQHLERLLDLLPRLEPGLQAVFMAAMRDSRAERAFSWRIAASDHHGYPGGLFDQSVRAAELAYAASYANDHERGLATLAALLFDFGKVFDRRLASDKVRAHRATGPTPHASTVSVLEPALRRADELQQGIAAELRTVLEAALRRSSSTGAPAPLDRVRVQVRAAVRQSWSEGSTHGR